MMTRITRRCDTGPTQGAALNERVDNADINVSREKISLGLEAAWGFSGADVISPAQAAASDALPDQRFGDGEPTEFRIHGVSGSDGPTMLQHPHAVQVAGKSPTAIYRRWEPGGRGRLSVPWPLEAYSWGGLTEKPLAAALWIVLAPFMLYNVAFFMLPAGGAKSTYHRWARRIMRLLALAGTAQFVNGAVILLVNTIGWQNAFRRGGNPSWWIGWYTQRGVGLRAAVALVVVGGIIGGLWRASVRTVDRYENRETRVSPEEGHDWKLRKRGFWHGATVVTRQRHLHVGAAFAFAALSGALLPTQHAVWRVVEVLAATIVLLVSIGATASSAVDREHQIDHRRGASRNRFRAVAYAGALVLGATALSCSWMADQTAQAPAADALLSTTRIVLAIQCVLLLGLVVTIWMLLRSGEPQSAYGWRPFLRGWLAPLVSLLAVLIGGLLSAAVNIAVIRLFGQPRGAHLSTVKPTASIFFVPDEMFAFAIGTVAILMVMPIIVWMLCRSYGRKFSQFIEGDDQVRACYPDAKQASDDAVDQVAKAWAIASLTDRVDVFVTIFAVAWTTGVTAVEMVALLARSQLVTWVSVIEFLVTAGVAICAAATTFLVSTLRSAYANPGRRRQIGALWDVATFWPRATHPLAPPCYAEQAVPEIVDRVVLLTGERSDHHSQPSPGLRPPPAVSPNPVLITGYSQGSLIAPAVVAQLPPQIIEKVALLTLACPFRRLYGRAFPDYFNREHAVELCELLTDPGASGTDGQQATRTRRWSNIVRRTDYIGSWIFSRPTGSAQQLSQNTIDVLCLDPPSLRTGPGGALAPIHYHSDWWQDPLTRIYASKLIAKLKTVSATCATANISAARTRSS